MDVIMYIIYIIDTGYKYYTGMTSERCLKDRIQEHINRTKSGYMKKWHATRQKKPAYIEKLYHNCYECATIREKIIKKLSRAKKLILIKSKRNDLLKTDIRFGKVKGILLRN